MIQAGNKTAAIVFDGRTVTITRHRDGFVPAGTRTIPVGQITAIRWKPASTWSGPGHIKLVIAGTSERRYSQTKILKTDVLKDENAVPFSRKQQPEFEAVKQAIDQALAGLAAGSAPAVGGSLADELGKLQQLLEAKVLTREEFDLAKARLLG